MQVGDVNYEILVRRQGETVYSAFCPQLELIVRGTAHEQVENKMKELIMEHVAKLEQAKQQKGEAG
jgi:predicted RNase H-like HicB family nuclease